MYEKKEKEAPTKSEAATKEAPTNQGEVSPNEDTHKNVPMNWESKFMEEAEEIIVQEAEPGLKAISTQGGVMKVDRVPFQGNKFLCVVIGDVFENAFYTTSYDPQNLTPPVCYAFSDIGEDMRPHADAKEPKNSDCATCYNNQWHTAEKGVGKACTNIRKLGIVIIGKWNLKQNGYDIVENVNAYKGQVYSLKVPPTSLKSFSTYKRSVADSIKRPLYSVLTEVECIPGSPAFKLNFTYNDKVGYLEDGSPMNNIDELYNIINNRRYEVTEQLKRPYSDFEKKSDDVKPNAERKY